MQILESQNVLLRLKHAQVGGKGRQIRGLLTRQQFSSEPAIGGSSVMLSLSFGGAVGSIADGGGTRVVASVSSACWFSP